MNISSGIMILLLTVFVNADYTSFCNEYHIRHNAHNFFNACESGKGWNGTKMFVLSKESPFNAEVTDSLPGPKLSDVKTVKDYTVWMAGVVKEFGPKATVEIKNSAVDKEHNTAIFYAVFANISDYVYTLNFDENTCKINSMHKIWNDGYAAKHTP